MLIKQKPAGNELGDYYKNLFFRKLGLLYSKGQFSKVAKLTKGASDINTRAFYFRSLYRKGDTDKGLMALREYLRTENERLIYIRGHFEEFTDDAVIRDVLIEVRSEEEYQEMINCLTQEKEQQKAFEEFAREMRTFYDRKTAKIVNKK